MDLFIIGVYQHLDIIFKGTLLNRRKKLLVECEAKYFLMSFANIAQWIKEDSKDIEETNDLKKYAIQENIKKWLFVLLLRKAFSWLNIIGIERSLLR
jgi:hypothetical protein